ncbi:MAG: hypothetical protein E7232_01330 [Lachnospiraceae bacterium]|nr:hypothetical protein [Lachnospiraceae bacterium]
MSSSNTNQPNGIPHISRDLNVELLRIIACLMVIMIHVRPFPFSGTTLRDAVIFINVMNGPAVAAFFLISGFFISPKQTLSHIILRFIKGVILPTAVFVFCLGLIRPWIDTPDMGLLQSILNSQPLAMFSDMLQGFLAFDTVRFGIYADHLWYIFSYASIMFWMPVILALVKHDETIVLKLMLLIGIFHYTLVNLSALVILPIGIYMPETIGKPALYTIAGYLFYSWIKKVRSTYQIAGIEKPHAENVKGKSDTLSTPDISMAAHDTLTSFFRTNSAVLLFFLLFVFFSLLLFFLQKHVYMQGLMTGRSVDELNTDYYFTSWSGFLCALQTTAFAGAVLLLPLRLHKSAGSNDYPASARLISTLGGYTFYIYLIHYIFTNHFRAIGFEDTLKAMFGESSFGLIMYTLSYSVFVFLLCASLIFIYRKLWKTILCLFQKI